MPPPLRGRQAILVWRHWRQAAAAARHALRELVTGGYASQPVWDAVERQRRAQAAVGALHQVHVVMRLGAPVGLGAGLQ